MLKLLRLLTRVCEILLSAPARVIRISMQMVSLPQLGPLRYLVHAGLLYVMLALVLVYVIAPLRGVIGAQYLSARIHYDAERWLATAIYDRYGNFVGTFDPRLDSARDVNYTSQPIEIGDYVANPDHKSIPVRDVPEHYWKCLLYHEDRNLGGLLNPYGIDLIGVLKIPLSSISRSISARRPMLGAGGSTLPMQFARVIYNTPPHAGESAFDKLGRKFREWWLAPVIFHVLTRDGDDTPLQQWAANHIWLAQRTGGQPLHGVEVTSRIVFGKEARDLTIAEQYVLASAVNKPIILLEGSERLNAVRLDRWRYIAEVRARVCAERLLSNDSRQKDVLFELIGLAGGPPDPKVRPRLRQALEAHAPSLARRAQANPIARANILMPAARLGLREEMKQVWGYDWRSHVRGITATIDVGENLTLRRKLSSKLAEIDKAWNARINPGYTLDPARVDADRRSPDVVVVAADLNGEIVRYYESSQAAPYFGSLSARDHKTGRYVSGRESRRLASTGKIIAAIAIANQLRDGADALYHDDSAPAGSAIATCAKGNEARGRRAEVAFACSLNRPVEWRLAQAGQTTVRHLIDRFGFNMPPAASSSDRTPPSTAVVRGLISGSPQRVHQMAAVVLSSLVGRGNAVVRMPTLAKGYDFTDRHEAAQSSETERAGIVPDRLIRRDARSVLRQLLQAPLCYRLHGRPQGTLKDVAAWCADRRSDVRLHFAKTGTDVGTDAGATVDTWIVGGLQFTNGAAYSYVVLIGTGSTAEPWARNLHASQVAAPLLRMLLEDLAGHAKRNPVPSALPSASVTAAAASAAAYRPAGGISEDDMRRLLGQR
ncbi:MAG: transglycosylase domain-containing protein [Hyphomicrobiaceae bacterium]